MAPEKRVDGKLLSKYNCCCALFALYLRFICALFSYDLVRCVLLSMAFLRGKILFIVLIAQGLSLRQAIIMTMGSSMPAPASCHGTRMMHQKMAAGMAANPPM